MTTKQNKNTRGFKANWRITLTHKSYELVVPEGKVQGENVHTNREGDELSK